MLNLMGGVQAVFDFSKSALFQKIPCYSSTRGLRRNLAPPTVPLDDYDFDELPLSESYSCNDMNVAGTVNSI